MIDKATRNALFLDVHNAITESAESVVELDAADLAYPPGVELTADEAHALSLIQLTEPAKSGLRKLVANACSNPIFQFFSLLDGVADPSVDLQDVWLGATLEVNTSDEDEPMLHDEFFESYWQTDQLNAGPENR